MNVAEPRHRALARPLELVCWLGFGLSVWGVYVQLEHGLIAASILFNSDSLWLAELWADLRAGGHLSDWNLPHATFFFPDALAWFAAQALSPSVQWAMVLFGASQITAAAALTRWLLAREFGPLAAPVGPTAWSLVCLAISQHHGQEALDALKPVHHFSVGLVALLAAVLLAGALRTGGWRWWLPLLTMTFAATASDPFALTCILGPLIAILAVVLLRDGRARRSRLSWGAGLGLAGLAGHALARALTNVGAIGALHPEHLRAGWQNLGEGLSTLSLSFFDVLAAFGLACFVPLFVRGLRRSREPTLEVILDLLPLTVASLNTLALIATRNLDAGLFGRYQIVSYLLLVVTLARVASGAMAGPRTRVLLAAEAAALTLASAAMLLFQATAVPRRFELRAYRPPLAACLASLPRRADLHRGLATYWLARPMTLLDPAGPRLEPVRADGRPLVWVNDPASYLRGEAPYDFIVLDTLDADALVARHGAPSEIFDCGNRRVWFYAPEAAARLTANVRADAQGLLEPPRCGPGLGCGGI